MKNKKKLLKFINFFSVMVLPITVISCNNIQYEPKPTRNKYKEEKLNVEVDQGSRDGKTTTFKINYVEEKGNKTKVLFIHGYNSSLWEYLSLFDEENRNYNIIAIDLPGNGNSSYDIKTQKSLSLELYAKAVKSFIKAKKLNNLIVFGHSLGGAVAALVAGEMEEVKKDILLAPFNPYALEATVEKFSNYKPLKEALDKLAKDKDPVETLKDVNDMLKEKKDTEIGLVLDWVKLMLQNDYSQKGHKDYNIVVNEFLSLEYPNKGFKDNFKKANKKTQGIIGEDDYIICPESIEKLEKNDGFQFKHYKNFGHRPEVQKENWEKVKRDIKETVKEVSDSLKSSNNE